MASTTHPTLSSLCKNLKRKFINRQKRKTKLSAREKNQTVVEKRMFNLNDSEVSGSSIAVALSLKTILQMKLMDQQDK